MKKQVCVENLSEIGVTYSMNKPFSNLVEVCIFGDSCRLYFYRHHSSIKFFDRQIHNFFCCWNFQFMRALYIPHYPNRLPITDNLCLNFSE